MVQIRRRADAGLADDHGAPRLSFTFRTELCSFAIPASSAGQALESALHPLSGQCPFLNLRTALLALVSFSAP